MEVSKAVKRDEQPGQGRVRLVLLDDHLLFRESLGRLLASQQDFELVAECTTPSEALESLKGVDVILVDLRIAKEFIPRAREMQYPGKSLVIAREIDALGSAIALKWGASGVFLDSDGSARLLQAIRVVAAGETWVDQKVIQVLAERFPQYKEPSFSTLTQRERTVLQGVIDGLSNRKIGSSIGVSESMIKGTLQLLFNKAGVRKRSQLVRIALEDPPTGIPRTGQNGSS